MPMPRPLDPDIVDTLIAELTGELERLRAATYQGSDPNGLAIATVDGDGTILKIRFARPVSRYHPVAVGEAVRVAVAAAQQRVAEAFGELAKRAEAWTESTEGAP
jgi:hypothetical protein